MLCFNRIFLLEIVNTDFFFLIFKSEGAKQLLDIHQNAHSFTDFLDYLYTARSAPFSTIFILPSGERKQKIELWVSTNFYTLLKNAHFPYSKRKKYFSLILLSCHKSCPPFPAHTLQVHRFANQTYGVCLIFCLITLQ